MYEFIAIIDRDEFIHVQDTALKAVDLPAMLHSILDGTDFASVGLEAARCGRVSILTHAPCTVCSAAMPRSCKECCVHAVLWWLAYRSQASSKPVCVVHVGPYVCKGAITDFRGSSQLQFLSQELLALKVVRLFGSHAGTACTAGRGALIGWASR